VVSEVKGEAILETHLPLTRFAVGKVRDIYSIGSDKLLIVTTDRLSAFDVVMPNPIPLKGKVLNNITLFWLDHFRDIIPQHLITADVDEMGLPENVVKDFRHEIEGRSMLVKKARPLEIECVVRGYITGSGWKDYQRTGMVCGHKLLPGMKQCEKFPEPIFTPSTKADSGHDVNITEAQAAEIVGKNLLARLRDHSLAVFARGARHAEQLGIIVADTKLEFGMAREPGGTERLLLIDEVLTPDSSRFWPADAYRPGGPQPSFDKQYVRDYLEAVGWNKQPPAPELPPDVVAKTREKYVEAFRRLTGRELS